MSEQNSIDSNNNSDNNLFLSNQNLNTIHQIMPFNNLSNEESNNINKESPIKKVDNKINKHKNSRSKYRQDCLRRRLKKFVLKYAFIFIKEKIKIKYNCDIIKKIGNPKTKNINIAFEKEFTYQTLGEIFSAPINSKNTTIPDRVNFNKNKIDYLKSSDITLKNIFDVTFIECLKHFMGIKTLKILKGMKTFEEIKTSENIDKMEEKNLNFISSNYEEIMKRSKPRHRI